MSQWRSVDSLRQRARYSRNWYRRHKHLVDGRTVYLAAKWRAKDRLEALLAKAQ